MKYIGPSITQGFLTDLLSKSDDFDWPGKDDEGLGFYQSKFSELYGKSPNQCELILYKMISEYNNSVISKNEARNVYIKDKSSVDKYCPNLDHRILDAYDSFVNDVRTLLPNCSCNLIGGKVSDYFDGKTFEESDGDYDIWFCSDEFVTDLKFQLPYRFGSKYEVGTETHRYIELKTVVNDKQIIFQIIKQQFPSIEDILNGFDFLHCCVGYDGNAFFWKRGALKSIKKKEIFVNRIAPTKVLNERLVKYIQRGYTISFPSFSLLSISTMFGMMGSEINEKMFFKYLAQAPEEFLDLRGSNGGY